MELMAYERIRGPIGGGRFDQLVAFLCSIYAAANGGGPIQFPDWWGPNASTGGKPKLTVEQAGKSMMAMGMAKVVKK